MKSEDLYVGGKEKKDKISRKSEGKVDLGLEMIKDMVDFHKKLFKKRGFCV